MKHISSDKADTGSQGLLLYSQTRLCFLTQTQMLLYIKHYKLAESVVVTWLCNKYNNNKIFTFFLLQINYYIYPKYTNIFPELCLNGIIQPFQHSRPKQTPVQTVQIQMRRLMRSYTVNHETTHQDLNCIPFCF